MPTEITISQFTNIIHSMLHGGYVQAYQYSNNRDTVQLPEDVYINFRKLNLSINSKKMGRYFTPETEFNRFIDSLVKYARLNHWYYPSAEKAHAEYLLGFLLHGEFIIKINDRDSLSMEDLVYSKLPSHEEIYFKTGHCYWFHQVPASIYDFLIPEWRAQQHYPTLEGLKAVWDMIIAEKQQRKTTKALERQRVEQEWQTYLQQQHSQHQHRFDHLNLGYDEISYVLEAYTIWLDQKLAEIMTDQTLPCPSEHLRESIQVFSQHARTMDVRNMEQLSVVNHQLAAFMSLLIHEAKQDDSCCGDYARLLLGFLLYHNFSIGTAGNIDTVANFFWNQQSTFEKNMFQWGFSQHLYFARSEWQQQQDYPGKSALEEILAEKQRLEQIQQQTHDSLFSCNAFLSAYQSLQQQSYPRSSQVPGQEQNPTPRSRIALTA